MLVKKPANAWMVQHPEDDCGSHKNRQSEQPGPREHECALFYKRPDFNRVSAAGQGMQGAENGGWPSCGGQGGGKPAVGFRDFSQGSLRCFPGCFVVVAGVKCGRFFY